MPHSTSRSLAFELAARSGRSGDPHSQCSVFKKATAGIQLWCLLRESFGPDAEMATAGRVAQSGEDEPSMSPVASDRDWLIAASRLFYHRNLLGQRIILGRGGYGKVYKGKLLGWPQPVAIKVLEFDGVSIEVVREQTRRALREQLLLQNCDSPYIVGFLGAFTTRQCAGMVFELMPRGDLAKALGAGDVKLFGQPLAHERAANILRDIILGMIYLHERRVCHLDLKSKNILLDSDFGAKIADVGIARQLSQFQVHTEGTIAGTMAWAAPEVLIADYPVTMQADIYAMGIIIWELCTCLTPVRGCVRADECPQMQHIIAACMRRRPNQRPTAQQLLVVAEGALSGSSASTSLDALPSSMLDMQHPPIIEGPSRSWSSAASDVDQNFTFLSSETGHTGTSNAPDILMQFDWRIEPARISVLRDASGSPIALGRGAYGKVYHGTIDSADECAIEVLDKGAQQNQMQEVIQEMNMMSACRSSHIVRFLGAWLQGKPAYMVTELMPGGNLCQALAADEHGIFCWTSRGKQTALDVALGLHFLHLYNVVHRDIKSSNILLDKDHRAKIASAGLSHLQGSQQSLSLAGSYDSMAPELMTGEFPATTKSDIFSFGALLYEICTQDPPHRGRLRPLRAPEECPQIIADLMQACLQKEPADRPDARQIVTVIKGS